jgi:hypothetical protein
LAPTITATFPGARIGKDAERLAAVVTLVIVGACPKMILVEERINRIEYGK